MIGRTGRKTRPADFVKRVRISVVPPKVLVYFTFQKVH